MMREAETVTGTPCRVSCISSPELTSFTETASSAYLSGHNHCSHRSTCGIELRWTKKPANVIWYSPLSAPSRSARPPSRIDAPRRKFCRYRARGDASENMSVQKRVNHLTNRVITIVYSMRISRYLKKLTACGARPAIQYVLAMRMSQ